MTPAPSPANRLYFGDCLEVMPEYIDSATVDLIYLDPPFNSKRIYNAYIEGQSPPLSPSGHKSEARTAP